MQLKLITPQRIIDNYKDLSLQINSYEKKGDKGGNGIEIITPSVTLVNNQSRKRRMNKKQKEKSLQKEKRLLQTTLPNAHYLRRHLYFILFIN